MSEFRRIVGSRIGGGSKDEKKYLDVNSQGLRPTTSNRRSSARESLDFVLHSGFERDRGLFVAEGGHGIEAAGAEGGDVAGGAGDEGEGGGGESQGEWIVGREAEELALDYAGQGEGSGNACHDTDGNEEENFTHDQPDDVAAGGAESDSNADFAGTLGNGVGHDAVEADDREKSGEKPEDGGEAGDHALGGEGVVDLDFRRAHGVDGR